MPPYRRHFYYFAFFTPKIRRNNGEKTLGGLTTTIFICVSSLIYTVYSAERDLCALIFR